MFFDQNYVVPTVLCQVVGHADADGTTTDDDHSCLSFHIVSSPFAYKYSIDTNCVSIFLSLIQIVITPEPHLALP